MSNRATLLSSSMFVLASLAYGCAAGGQDDDADGSGGDETPGSEGEQSSSGETASETADGATDQTESGTQASDGGTTEVETTASEDTTSSNDTTGGEDASTGTATEASDTGDSSGDTSDSSGDTSDSSDTSDSDSSGETTGGCLPAESACDGIDEDCNGLIDDLDVGNDGICDCLDLLLLGDEAYSASSDLGAWLGTRGAIVERDETVSDTIDATYLAGVDIVIAQHLPRALTTDEADAIEAWVTSEGAGLVALTGFNYDMNDPAPERTRANTLLAPFELAYAGDYLLTSGGTATLNAGHPITDGLTSLQFAGGFTVTSTGTGTSTIATVPSATVVAIARERGEGRVLAWGDDAIALDDEWSEAPDTPEFWTQTLAWASPPGVCFRPAP